MIRSFDVPPDADNHRESISAHADPGIVTCITTVRETADTSNCLLRDPSTATDAGSLHDRASTTRSRRIDADARQPVLPSPCSLETSPTKPHEMIRLLSWAINPLFPASSVDLSSPEPSRKRCRLTSNADQRAVLGREARCTRREGRLRSSGLRTHSARNDARTRNRRISVDETRVKETHQ